MTTVRSEDKADGVRLLTMERPPANAITAALLTDLSAALRAANDDEAVRAVVLTGNGAFFSAGLDLRGAIDFASAAEGAAGGNPFHALQTCLLDFLRFPKPIVCMLRGHAIAGGLILVLACDYRLGLDGEYRIGLNEVAIGASFPKAAFEIVRLRCTHAQASELLLGAAIYPANQAPRLGVVDELIAEDKFEDTVMRRAARLGSFPREAFAHTKLALTAEAIARIESESPEETQKMVSVWMTPESVAARAEQAKKLARG